jgi:hypothetical protein
MAIQTNKVHGLLSILIIDYYSIKGNPLWQDDSNPYVSVVAGENSLQVPVREMLQHGENLGGGSMLYTNPRIHLLHGKGFLSSLGGIAGRIWNGIKSLFSSAPQVVSTMNAAQGAYQGARDIYNKVRDDSRGAPPAAPTNATGSGSSIQAHTGYTGNMGYGIAQKRGKYC